jgi:hypothetical protein
MSISSQSNPAPAAISVAVVLARVSQNPTCFLLAWSARLKAFGDNVAVMSNPSPVPACAPYDEC